MLWPIRDEIFGMKKGVLESIDPGVTDKRLLLDEREMHRGLAVMQRTGNTLSAMVRDAWDGREVIESLTKHSQLKVTNPHISIVGHITGDELVEHLERTEIVNGYANRFLLCCVRRGKKLALGGEVPEAAWLELGRKANATIARARTIGKAAEGLSAHGDSFGAAIAHNQRDGDTDLIILDWLQEWRPPFNPADIVRAISGVLDEYHLAEIAGDHHAAGFVINELGKCNKRLVDCPLSKSDLYLEILPRFSEGRVRLVDSDRLVNQLCSLERRALSGGHDRVDHARGGRDDLSNAAAGALWLSSRKRGIIHISDAVKAWSKIPQRGAYGSNLVS
jgi:hypothetical protein